jgi:hypothetical protein
LKFHNALFEDGAGETLHRKLLAECAASVAQIVDDLEAALEQFRLIATDLDAHAIGAAGTDADAASTR